MYHVTEDALTLEQIIQLIRTYNFICFTL